MFNAEKVKNDCVNWIRDFFENNGKGCNAVLGISGGKDSSVVAALCVEALGGAPGVYSARYAGGHGDDKANRNLLLKNLQGENNRRAYFESAIALVYPDGREFVANGRTYGNILQEEQGEGGFGYDCIFESEDLKKSFGLATPAEKNSVSHRFRALTKLKEMLEGNSK